MTTYVSGIIEVRPHNHCPREKAISITHAKCLCVSVALIMKLAKRMRRLSPVRPLWFFSICLHCLINGTIFGGGKKKMLLNTKCVLIFFTSFV